MKAMLTKVSAGLLLVGSSWAITACATRGTLVPLKGESSALALPIERGGQGAKVLLEVRPNVWKGVPDRLTKVTPVLVSIENDQPESIRIRYNEFALRTPDGRVYCALPPFDINESQSVPVPTVYPMAGFWVAPYQARFFPRFRRWGGAFAYDPLYFQTNFSYWQRFNLPTADMLAKALPEGVLEPQGKVTGFLYFENIEPDVEEVEFVAQIVAAKSKARLAEARIPFDVD